MGKDEFGRERMGLTGKKRPWCNGTLTLPLDMQCQSTKWIDKILCFLNELTNTEIKCTILKMQCNSADSLNNGVVALFLH